MGVKAWGATVSHTQAYPLAGATDASGQTWYEVPGYGFVNWTHEQITEHARYVFGFHRPGQTGVRVRIAWGLVPLVWPGRHCKVCQTAWPCRTGRWVRNWLGAVAVVERNRADDEPSVRSTSLDLSP
jgi:hypothetical protein